MGAQALAEALADSSLETRLQRNTQAYHDSTADRLPVLMAPAMDSIVGRPEGEQELFDLLEQELEITPDSN